MSNLYMLKNYHKLRHDVLNIECLPYIYLSQIISPDFTIYNFLCLSCLHVNSCILARDMHYVYEINDQLIN
jgi:hypothetical protein